MWRALPWCCCWGGSRVRHLMVRCGRKYSAACASRVGVMALLSGRGVLRRSSGGGRLLIGTTGSRCGRWVWPADARSAIEVMTTVRPKRGCSGAPTFPCGVTPCPAPTSRGIGSRCSPGSRLSRPDPSPPTRGPGGDVLGCRARRDGEDRWPGWSECLCRQGRRSPAGVCGRGGRLEPAVIARTTPDRDLPGASPPFRAGLAQPARSALLAEVRLEGLQRCAPAKAANYDGDHRCSRWLRTR
jgi:hypothetical protein